MTEQLLNEKIVSIIESITNSSLEPQDGLLDNGVLDSLMTMQVIEAIEKEFGITLETEDFTHENFNSVAAIAAMVEKYQQNG